MSSHKPTPHRLTSFVLLALLISSAAVVKPVSAGVIVVNSNTDVYSDNGECTLREAIDNANNDSQGFTSVGECAAGFGYDIITFEGDYTITMNSKYQNFKIESEIEIDGNGSANTIIQASECNPVTLPGGCTPAENLNVFEVASTASLTLDGVTVRYGNGYSGGGIYNLGSLSVYNSTIYGNRAQLFGGGIFSFGKLTVRNSTLSENYAESGGGIENWDLLNVTDSTLSGNTALSNGGGILNRGTTKVTNSTLSENNAESTGAGIYNGMGSLTVRNSTLTGNISPSDGEGIYLYMGDLSFINTIITHSSHKACEIEYGRIVDSVHNLVTDGSCFVETNLSGDPKLGPLADNGGPTLTHALLRGSAAVDAGFNPFCEHADQRGVARPQDGNLDGVAVCDIGAFELKSTVFNIHLPLILN